VLTWGLIGPGKGIEWAIAALGQLRDLRPTPRYLVAGRTHPKVLAEQGESYRAYLRRRARRFGVADLDEFDPAYRTATALTALLRQADMVLLPYDSTVKVSSGVLVEAVAAGRPVIATGFSPSARTARRRGRARGTAPGSLGDGARDTQSSDLAGPGRAGGRSLREPRSRFRPAHHRRQLPLTGQSAHRGPRRKPRRDITIPPAAARRRQPRKVVRFQLLAIFRAPQSTSVPPRAI